LSLEFREPQLLQVDREDLRYLEYQVNPEFLEDQDLQTVLLDL